MIHQYKNNGYNIVLDVNSGSVHVVDDCVYEIVPVLEPILKAGLSGETAIEAACMACEKLPYSSNEIREVCEELIALHEAGQLYTGYLRRLYN